MCSNYSTKLKLVIIVSTLISSIPFVLSLDTAYNSLSINKFAFAEQNPVLPNYRGDHQAFEPSKMLDNRTNLASSDSQPKSMVHYPPITPATNYYTGNSNEAGINSLLTSTTNVINSTNPSGIVQPISLPHYQPIAPSGSENPIRSTDNIYSGGLEHAGTNEGSHQSSNDNSHDGGSHSGSTQNSHDGGSHSGSTQNSHDGGSHSGSTHKSSSNHNNNDHAGRTTSHHSSNHSGGHHNGASASAGGGGASASAGGASASAGGGGASASAD